MTEPPWLAAPRRRALAMRARLPHALLVQGPEGWGQEQVAAALALDLLGLAPNRAAAEVAHPDLRWLAPENGAIRVDAVRGIVEFLVQTPQLAPRKVAVLAAAECMNANAANALLKTLEEPPAESFIVLSSGHPGRLLPTIRSRCQRLDLHPAPPGDVLAWLAASGADMEPAGYLAVEYGGAPFAAMDALAREQPPLWPALALVSRDAGAVAKVAEERREDDLAELAGRWLAIVHWLLRQSVAEGAAKAAPALMAFAEELLVLREAALLNPALGKPLQLRRLLLLWRRLSRALPASPPRLTAAA